MCFDKNLQKRLRAEKKASGGKSWIGQENGLNDIRQELQPEDFLGIYIYITHINVELWIYE